MQEPDQPEYIESEVDATIYRPSQGSKDGVRTQQTIAQVLVRNGTSNTNDNEVQVGTPSPNRRGPGAETPNSIVMESAGFQANASQNSSQIEKVLDSPRRRSELARDSSSVEQSQGNIYANEYVLQGTTDDGALTDVNPTDSVFEDTHQSRNDFVSNLNQPGLQGKSNLILVQDDNRTATLQSPETDALSQIQAAGNMAADAVRNAKNRLEGQEAPKDQHYQKTSPPSLVQVYHSKQEEFNQQMQDQISIQELNRHIPDQQQQQQSARALKIETSRNNLKLKRGSIQDVVQGARLDLMQEQEANQTPRQRHSSNLKPRSRELNQYTPLKINPQPMDINEQPEYYPTTHSPSPFVSQYAPGEFTGMTNHRSPFARRQSEAIKIAKELPTQPTEDTYNPEQVPKTLTYTNSFQPKLGDIRDQVRRNSIFHKEFEGKYEEKQVEQNLGHGIIDSANNVYDPIEESKDLMGMLVPKHLARIKYAERNVKLDSKSRVFDKDYPTTRKPDRTYVLDAIEEETRKKNVFNLKEHNKKIAQYRVAKKMLKEGKSPDLRDFAQSPTARKMFKGQEKVELKKLQEDLDANLEEIQQGPKGDQLIAKFKKMAIGRGYLKIYRDEKNRIANKQTSLEAFQQMRINIERLVERGKNYREEDDEDVVGFVKQPVPQFQLQPRTERLIKITQQKLAIQKRSPRKFGLPPIVVSERELEIEEGGDKKKKNQPPKIVKPDKELTRAERQHWKVQLLQKTRSPEQRSVLRKLKKEREATNGYKDHMQTEVDAQSTGGFKSSLFTKTKDGKSEINMNETQQTLDSIKSRIKEALALRFVKHRSTDQLSEGHSLGNTDTFGKEAQAQSSQGYTKASTKMPQSNKHLFGGKQNSMFSLAPSQGLVYDDSFADLMFGDGDSNVYQNVEAHSGSPLQEMMQVEQEKRPKEIIIPGKNLHIQSLRAGRQCCEHKEMTEQAIRDRMPTKLNDPVMDLIEFIKRLENGFDSEAAQGALKEGQGDNQKYADRLIEAVDNLCELAILVETGEELTEAEVEEQMKDETLDAVLGAMDFNQKTVDEVLGSPAEAKLESMPDPVTLCENTKRNITSLKQNRADKKGQQRGFRFNPEIDRFLFNRDPVYRDVFSGSSVGNKKSFRPAGLWAP